MQEEKNTIELQAEAAAEGATTARNIGCEVRTGWKGTPGDRAADLLHDAANLLKMEAALCRVQNVLIGLGYFDGDDRYPVGEMIPGEFRIEERGFRWDVIVKAEEGDVSKVKLALIAAGTLDGWGGDDAEAEDMFTIAGNVSVLA